MDEELMEKCKLTSEDLDGWFDSDYNLDPTCYDDHQYTFESFQNYLLQKVIPIIYEWGNEPCLHEHTLVPELAIKRRCNLCWQALKHE